MAPVVVVPLGPLLWGTLHLVALATIRNLGVVLLAVVTYPFALRELELRRNQT